MAVLEQKRLQGPCSVDLVFEFIRRREVATVNGNTISTTRFSGGNGTNAMKSSTSLPGLSRCKSRPLTALVSFSRTRVSLRCHLCACEGNIG